MNADMLRRLFGAVKIGSDADLISVCQRIVDSERQRGHDKLASELESLLQERSAREESNKLGKPAISSLKPLSTNRRDAAPLVKVFGHDMLRHHMVLPGVVEQHFENIEREYSARTRLARFGLQAARRILLYGPPGCGKSLGAERLAWSTGLPLHKVRFDTLISSYFGETAVNLQKLFESAEEQPCALFFDECDTIALARGRNNEVGEASRIVNVLLQLMEDFRGDGLVIAATNLYEGLDKAIYRRFDVTVELPFPGVAEIERLLKTTLSALDVGQSLRYDLLARSLDGLSCSDIVKIAQRAAKRCLLSGRDEITADDLEASSIDARRYS